MLSSASFDAMGCVNTVGVPEREALAAALAIAEATVRKIDATCSRFRDDSELAGINAAGGGEFVLSPLLAEAVAAALRSAEMTGGLVDPTLGGRLRELGYTVTFRDVPAEGPPLRLRAWAAPDWRSLHFDARRRTLRLPPGVQLDLGASGKAWAADRTAAAVAAAVEMPVVVSCGGDVATAGPPPAGGWPVRVEAQPGADGAQDVLVFDGGLATSGIGARRWRRGSSELHHILDPATGLPAETPWAMVSVAGASCVDANAAATAAVILGEEAPGWLRSHGLPARLVRRDGAVEALAGWPSAQ